MPHGYLPDLNAEYDYTKTSVGDVIEAQIRINAEEFFRDHWPRSFLMPDGDQWHCSNCGGIFKQVREPAIPYCPWCGHKFIKIDPECMLSKHMAIPPEKYELSPKDICQAKHGVDSCGDCEECKE